MDPPDILKLSIQRSCLRRQGLFTEQNNRIGCLDPAKNTIKDWAVPTASSAPRCITIYGGKGYHYGICEDSMGNIFFTEYEGNQIGKLKPKGGTLKRSKLPAKSSNPSATPPPQLQQS